MSTDAEPPWTKSKSGNVYCPLNNIPNEIRSDLKAEDNYVTEIGNFSYKVRVFDDNVLVFRERTGENKRICYCKICAQNGFANIPIAWRKTDGKWFPYDYDNSAELHKHLRQENKDME